MAPVDRDNPMAGTEKIRATFQTNSTKLYVPAVTLFTNNNIKFLENLKQGFKRKVSWK